MFTFPNINVTGSIGGKGSAVRAPVRVATVVAGTISTSFVGGSSVDGVTLAVDDRILIKNQVSAVENGIFLVQVAGTPVRTMDLDVGSSASGITVMALEGTINAFVSFCCTTLSPNDIVATNTLTFTNAYPNLSKVLGVGNTTGGNHLQFGSADNLQFLRTNVLSITSATITTTNRTLTLPDPLGNDSFIYAALTQTLTNKTISSSTNSVGANHIRTTGASVNVDLSAPPVIGQVLAATSATTATWQDVKPMLVEASDSASTAATSTTYVTIAKMTLAPAAGTYLATFSCSFRPALVANVTFYCAIFVNGVIVAHSERTMMNMNSGSITLDIPCHSQAKVVVNSSQVVDVRYKSSVANSITAKARSLSLLEVI